MAKGKRTTALPRGATVAKVTLQDRPHFAAMDSLNQALADLSGTVRALYAVDTHIDGDDHEACRVPLSRLLMADLATLEAAERAAWRVVVERKGGAK